MEKTESINTDPLFNESKARTEQKERTFDSKYYFIDKQGRYGKKGEKIQKKLKKGQRIEYLIGYDMKRLILLCLASLHGKEITTDTIQETLPLFVPLKYKRIIEGLTPRTILTPLENLQKNGLINRQKESNEYMGIQIKSQLNTFTDVFNELKKDHLEYSFMQTIYFMKMIDKYYLKIIENKFHKKTNAFDVGELQFLNRSMKCSPSLITLLLNPERKNMSLLTPGVIVNFDMLPQSDKLIMNMMRDTLKIQIRKLKQKKIIVIALSLINADSLTYPEIGAKVTEEKLFPRANYLLDSIGYPQKIEEIYTPKQRKELMKEIPLEKLKDAIKVDK